MSQVQPILPVAIPTAPSDGPWGRIAVAALLTLTVSIVLAFGATVLAISKAATKEESNATAIVFELHPYMMALGSLAALVLAASSIALAAPAVRGGEWGQAGLLVLAAVAVGAASHTLAWGVLERMDVEHLPVAFKAEGRVVFSGHGKVSLAGLVIAAVLWTGRCWWAQTRRVAAGHGAGAELGLAECIRCANGWQILSALPGACLSALAACLVVCLPISFLGLLRMTAPVGDFLAALGLTVCCMAAVVLLMSVALQLLRLLWIGLMWAIRTNGKTVALIGVLTGLFLFLLVRTALYMSFHAEMDKLGMDLIFDAALLVAGLLYGLAVSGNLLALSSSRRPADSGELVRLCILAGALLPVLPILHLLGRRTPLTRSLVVIGCLVLTGAVVALALPFFQKLDDHFSRINTTLALLILVLAVLLGQTALPPTSRAWRGKLLVLTVLAVPSLAVVAASPYQLGHAKAEMDIHSPLGKASSVLLSPLLPAPPRPEGSVEVSFATSAPGRDPVMEQLKARRPLTILVLWDACRPDHMSLYGYRRTKAPFVPTTPNLDAHKGQFVRFTNCFSHGTGTTCAMRQMLTARYSSRWMLRSKGVDPFWLNELARNGYDAFFLNIIGSDYNGISLDAFHRDMPADLKKRLSPLACDGCPASARESLKQKEKNIRTDYVDLPKASPEHLGHLADRLKLIECNRQNEQRSVEDLLAFLKTRKDTKGAGVFAYLHPDATHSPWQRFSEVKEDFGTDEKDLYDQCVRYCDFVTGKLIDGLKELDMWDDVVFIMMADHGTGLGEHGVYGGFHPWYEQIHVPLAIKFPGVKGREIDTMVGLMDLGPTLVNTFEDPPASYEGRSLWPVILHDRKWPDRVMFGLNAFNDCYYVMTAEGWHYIWHRANQYEQLFNWRQGPAEKRNLMGHDKAVTGRMQKLMNWFLSDYGKDRNYNDRDHYEAPDGQE